MRQTAKTIINQVDKVLALQASFFRRIGGKRPMVERGRAIVNVLVCCCITATLTACYEDKGNYDYEELNEISVVMPAPGTHFAVDRFDTLHIEPQLAFTQGAIDDSRLSFKWEMYLNDWANTEAKAVVLSEERTLDAVMSRPASTTLYALVLTVTDLQNGTAYRTNYSVGIQPSVLSGLVVLQDDGGRCRLDYLASTYAEPSFAQDRLIRDVYATANGGQSLLGTPRGVSFSLVEKSSYEPQVKNLYVWTDRQVARISCSDFTVEHLDNELFMLPPSVINVENIERSVSINYTTIMINDGQARALNQQAAMSYGFQFSRELKPNSSLEGEMRFSPYVYQPDLFGSQTGFCAILYDEIGKRFVKVASSYDVEPVLFSFNEQDEDVKSTLFDVNNIGMDMIWMGKNYGALAYALFTDGQKRHLYRMRFNVTNTTTDDSGEEVVNPQVYRQAAAKFDFSEATEGDQAKFFECGRFAANTMIYATDRNLYTYDFNAKKAILLNDPFPEGEQITAMNIYNVEYYTANLQEVKGTLLYVATWNGQEGKVYEFPINRTTLRLNNRDDANGNLKAPYNVFTGFGRVVSMCVKPQGRADVVE